MSHLLGSQQMPTATPTAPGNQPPGQPGMQPGHNYGMSGQMPPQSAPQAQQSQQQSGAEQKYDLIARVRPLVVSLKESLANLMKVAALNIEQNSQIDSGPPKSSENTAPRFDKALEDFFSICNQIELQLKTILECSIQSRDSSIYLPFNVSKTDSSDPNADSISYNQYLMTIKSQVNYAKAVHDMLVAGAKSISQSDTSMTPMNPNMSSTTPANNSVV